MTTLVIETTDHDYWPCPQACGGPTEDPYGGPCKTCWRTLSDPDVADARLRGWLSDDDAEADRG